MAARAQSRTAKNTADMVRSLVVTMVGGVLLFGTVFFVFYRDSHTAAVKAADPGLVSASLAQARRDFPSALLPSSTPKGWVVTSVRYATTQPLVLHLGYVTAATGPKTFVDLEVGSDVDDALDVFDGPGRTHATGSTVDGLQELKASDGTLTLRTATGVTPATGLTGTKDRAALRTLASVLTRS